MFAIFFFIFPPLLRLSNLSFVVIFAFHLVTNLHPLTKVMLCYSIHFATCTSPVFLLMHNKSRGEKGSLVKVSVSGA